MAFHLLRVSRCMYLVSLVLASNHLKKPWDVQFLINLNFQIPRDQDDELDDEFSQDGEGGDGGSDSQGVGASGDSSSKGQASGQSPGEQRTLKGFLGSG